MFFQIVFVLAVLGISIYVQSKNPKAFARPVNEDELDFEKPRRMSFWSRNSLDNRLIAHLYLASVMIRTNREESREKMQFVHRYIARNFRDASINAGEYMSEALRYDVDERSVCEWVKSKMPEEERWRLIEFLIALSLEDDVINELEFKNLKILGVACGLSDVGVEERIVRQRESRERANRPATPIPRREERKMQALAVLGLSEPVSLSDIKQQYRNLVKQYHPDGWNESSDLTKSEAEKRFLQVQEAYEYLETVLA